MTEPTENVLNKYDPNGFGGVGSDSNVSVPFHTHDGINSPKLNTGGTPAGSDTEIQFNDGGEFGASPDLIWDQASLALTLGVDDNAIGGFLSVAIQAANAVVTDNPGEKLQILAGFGNGTGAGGQLQLESGQGGTSGAGGDMRLDAGNGDGSSSGGYIDIVSGTNTGNAGGSAELKLYGGTPTVGGQVILFSGSGKGGNGGKMDIRAGSVFTSAGTGGQLDLLAGNGNDTGAGGLVLIAGGDSGATNANGGDIKLNPGNNSGSGTEGKVKLVDGSSNIAAVLNTNSLATSDKTFTFFNNSGSLNITNGNARAEAQTTANTNILTQAVGAADATFQLLANVLVTASTTHNFTVTVDYTDEGNTARTLTIPFSQLAGTIITAITNVTGAGPYEGVGLTIRAKASTNIVFKTAGTFTTVTYNVDCSVVQIA